MHSVIDRQTDGQTVRQQDDANSRSYCVAVRSTKKLDFLLNIFGADNMGLYLLFLVEPSESKHAGTKREFEMK